MADTGRKRKKRTAPRRPVDLDTGIVDAAIGLAEDIGWERVRLREVAAKLKISLADLHMHYRDLDAVADAWFDRATMAMLAASPRGFAALPADERLYLMVMRWFDALAAHRRVTGQMLAGKLYPAHLHHWVPMIFNLSRTIQWLRDAARLDATGRQRQMEEIGLTGLFLATLAVWLRDDTPEQERTRRFLRRRLANGDRLMARLWRRTTPVDVD